MRNFITLFFVSIILFSCKLKSQSEESGFMAEIREAKDINLPFYSKDDDDLNSIKNTSFDVVDSLIFKYSYKDYIFFGETYLDYGESDSPIIYLKLKSIDTSGELIDSLKIFKRYSYEDYYEEEDFKINENNTIDVFKNSYWVFTGKYEGTSKEDEYILKDTISYKIKPNGKIAHYYRQSNGEGNEKSNLQYPVLKDSVDQYGLDYKEVVGYEYYYNKGFVKDHLKEGKWEEYDNYNLLYPDWEGLRIIKSVGNYEGGEKEGEWKFYSVHPKFYNRFTIAESVIYKNGQVINEE